jgi:hypothetical protein
MRDAIAADQHHDQRRAILVELLRHGFGLTVETIELEHNVRVAKTRGRGAFWRHVREALRARQELPASIDEEG